VNILDRYLSIKKNNVHSKILQLIGCVCMWIASKYHEIYPPTTSDFMYISAQAFNEHDMINIEVDILVTLDFTITTSISYHFAEIYYQDDQLLNIIYNNNNNNNNNDYKKTVQCLQCLTQYLMEHALIDYSFVGVKQSQIAAAAVAFALLGTKVLSHWNYDMIKQTGYTIDELKSLLKQFENILKNKNSSQLSVAKKYQSKKMYKVALLNFGKIDVNNFC